MRGFSLFAAVVVVAVVGVLSLGIPVLVGQNQSLRMTEYLKAKAYWSDRAALEFAQSEIRWGTNPATLPTRYFVGSLWTFSRPGNQVQVSTTQSNANSTLTITDPNPEAANAYYLTVDTASARQNSNDLRNVTLQKNASTPSSITVSKVRVSWTGYTSSDVTQIRINNTTQYSGGSSSGPSGTTFTLSPVFTMSNTSTYSINRIRWDTIPRGVPITIQFVMSDNSWKTVTVTLP